MAMDQGKSVPEAGTRLHPNKSSGGYPLDVDSLEQSEPESGTRPHKGKTGGLYPLAIDSLDQSAPAAGHKPTSKSNRHGHVYPGRKAPAAKNPR